MQAYHSADRAYYPQQPYGAQPQYYIPPGYAYSQPGGQPIAAPFPMYPNMQPGTPAPGRARPLDREISRSSTPGRPGLRPLKSAMKRGRTPDHAASAPGVPHSRGRTPDTIHRQRTRSGSRMRANSIPQFVPDHLILTLRSSNTLYLENIPDPSIMDEVVEKVLPLWVHGMNSVDTRRGKLRAEFAGSPWSSSGLNEVLVGKMVIKLYIVLASLGYSYLATVNIGNPWKPPQLIFVDSTPYDALVFIIMLSKSGDRLTVVDGPPELTEQLGMELRATFPRKITTDRATEDGLHIFEVKRSSFGVAVDKSLLIAFILRFFNTTGFKLCGSVPMGTRSFFHFGERKEMWVFRSDWRPSSRQKEMGKRPSSRQSRRSPGVPEA